MCITILLTVFQGQAQLLAITVFNIQLLCLVDQLGIALLDFLLIAVHNLMDLLEHGFSFFIALCLILGQAVDIQKILPVGGF